MYVQHRCLCLFLINHHRALPSKLMRKAVIWSHLLPGSTHPASCTMTSSQPWHVLHRVHAHRDGGGTQAAGLWHHRLGFTSWGKDPIANTELMSKKVYFTKRNLRKSRGKQSTNDNQQKSHDKDQTVNKGNTGIYKHTLLIRGTRHSWGGQVTKWNTRAVKTRSEHKTGVQRKLRNTKLKYREHNKNHGCQDTVTA